MEYKEEEYLQLAGIQHFSFCRRQWALIHIEQEWAENVRTVEGAIVHEHAHDETLIEKRGSTLITRGLEVSSKALGIYGVCDVVEFHEHQDGGTLFHYDGTWLPMAVEYKRGKPKVNDADRLQLCAQSMCLEELFCCHIDKGALFYHEVAHRETVLIDDELRNKVRQMVKEMHELYAQQHTPKVKTGKFCNACSLNDICIPVLNKKIDISAYIRAHLEE